MGKFQKVTSAISCNGLAENEKFQISSNSSFKFAFMKILIIEDEAILNNAYKLILEREGHQVSIAFNGAEGLLKAEEDEPDIILLDLLMPTMSGLDFLEAYDAPGKHPKVKIIILSNIGAETEAEKGIKLGAYKYIVKAHASPRDLSTLVNHLINKNLDKKPVSDKD